jgi:hypothetical protein
VNETLENYAAHTRALDIACRGRSAITWPPDNDKTDERLRKWWCDDGSIPAWQWETVSRKMLFSIQEEFPEEDMRAAEEVFEEGI